MSTDGLTDMAKLTVTFRKFAYVRTKGKDTPFKLSLDAVVVIMR